MLPTGATLARDAILQDIRNAQVQLLESQFQLVAEKAEAAGVETPV